MPDTPDQSILRSVFDIFAKAEYPGIAEDDAFERFAVQQVLKPREVSNDELEAGIVDGSMDGGIDSFYVFVNGVLLDSDDPLLDPTSEPHKALARGPHVRVVMVQAKNSSSWKESVWDKLLSTLSNVLDLHKSDAELESLYNAATIERTGILRRLLNAFAGKFPKISFEAIYVCRAPEDNLTETVKGKADQVHQVIVSNLTSTAEVSVKHVGASGLYALAEQTWGQPATLTFRDLLRETSSFIGVVQLDDYLAFVRDPDGSLREELFDSNVRDFEGDNAVNRAITATLNSDDGIEFWWLNNGVTVLGDEVDGPQKTLTVSRPLIVNGLQTSHVLHRADKDGTLDPERLADGIVVRVIESTDEEVRDRVIAGTNRQTPVPGPALYATDPAQVRLEAYLKTKGFFYERRKNRYKNQGQPATKRVSMSLMAQVMITVLLGQPDFARARPSSILNRKGGYESVFTEGMDLGVYLRALKVLEQVDAFLKTEEAKDILDEPANVRFYVLAGYVMLQLRARSFAQVNFADNHSRIVKTANQADLETALKNLARFAKSYQRRHPEMSRDSVFKSADFRDRYFGSIGRAIPKLKKAAASK